MGTNALDAAPLTSATVREAMTTVSGDNALDLLVQIARLERERD